MDFILIKRDDFKNAYYKSVEHILSVWNEELQTIAAVHNVGWSSDRSNFSDYLFYSESRYWIAVNLLQRNGIFDSYCDIGGFLAAFPLALKRLGKKVAITENLTFYGEAFSGILELLKSEGVEIINIDPFENCVFPKRDYDAVGALAILEHFPHSPKNFLKCMSSLVRPDGCLYIEVPNIAYWPRRWALLRGKSPLVSIADIYTSAVPFTGHHHEYTLDELLRLVRLAGFNPVEYLRYNYSFRGPWIRRIASDPLLTLMTLHPSMKECISVAFKAAPITS